MRLTIHLKASHRTLDKYPVNQYAAERQARALLRTYRTDTRITKAYAPGQIILQHRDTGDRAVITLA
jgi:hypothetical protein